MDIDIVRIVSSSALTLNIIICISINEKNEAYQEYDK